MVIQAKTSQISPNIYIRNRVPEEYQTKMGKLSAQFIIEPWKLGEAEPEPLADISECNIVLTSGIRDSLEILEKAPNIKWVHSQSVGVEMLLKNQRVKDSDIIITNSRGTTSIPIAEHTIAMITSMARGVDRMIRNEENRVWGKIPIIDLEDVTVGIIGYGNIGHEIAKRCKALGMKVLGCRRNPPLQTTENEPADVVVGMDQVDLILEKSDFLVLSLPSTEETEHFLNKEKISLMKKGSHLINVGRGNTVVEEALVDGLVSGHLAGAALDVFEVEPLPDDHPFWTLDNVIVSPHNAYWSPKNAERNLDLFLRNLQLYIEGKPLINVVNKELGY